MSDAPDFTPDFTPVLSTLVMPAQGNLHGGVFGGWIMAQFDLAAGMAGRRHAGACVVRSVQELNFLAPLTVGDEFHVTAGVLREGRTSFTLAMEGWAQGEDGARRRVCEARIVMVCVDAEGRPRPIVSPPAQG